jgi:hypothetical protein
MARSDKIKNTTPSQIVINLAAIITGLAALFAIYELFLKKAKGR